jgi:outer membrane protein
MRLHNSVRADRQVRVTDQRVSPGWRITLSVLGPFVLLASVGAASAETLESALVRAYHANPTLNAQRASVRATDENVPRAKSLGRPRVNATADAGIQYQETHSGAGSTIVRSLPRGVGLQVDQNIFNGNRTDNGIRQAETQVFGARETLRNNEQTTLFNGVTAYMNVLRDTAILSLQRNNVEVLEEQLRQTRDRFNVGEVTRTDVAQAESRVAGSRSQVAVAEANLRNSIAVFRQVIGVEPRSLAPGRPIDRLVPRTLDTAVSVALDEHPAVKAALHAVDAAELQVKITEAELYPRLDLRGAASQRWTGTATAGGGDRNVGFGSNEASTFVASAVATLTVPIYEGGEVYARTRQAKETVGQRRLEADATRDQVRAAVVSAWGQLESSKASIIAAQAQVQAAETALSGVREEARVGQRTTLDVLNAQQELLNARVNLITAQRDRVVASYAVAQASGRLSSQSLALNIATYSAKTHYDQVKDLWGGLRTPDGR